MPPNNRKVSFAARSKVAGESRKVRAMFHVRPPPPTNRVAVLVTPDLPTTDISNGLVLLEDPSNATSKSPGSGYEKVRALEEF
jgi:hypothetical protein